MTLWKILNKQARKDDLKSKQELKSKAALLTNEKTGQKLRHFQAKNKETSLEKRTVGLTEMRV